MESGHAKTPPPRGRPLPTLLFRALRTEVHVRLADPGDCTDPALLERFEAELDAEERARCRRFLRERDRHLFLVAHALVRRTLSRYCAVPPAAWEFVAGAHGRPEIAHPLTDPPLRFNLSHTPGLAGCAVALDLPVGLDLERTREMDDLAGLARLSLAPGELHELLARGDQERPGHFLTLWTLKEAYSKARGLGIALPLRSYGFAIAGGSVRLLPPPDDDPGAWQFHCAQPDSGHHLAVAFRRGPGADRIVRIEPERFSP